MSSTRGHEMSTRTRHMKVRNNSNMKAIYNPDFKKCKYRKSNEIKINECMEVAYSLPGIVSPSSTNDCQFNRRHGP